MIKMKSGIYGLPVKHPDGRVTVKGVGPAYGPFSLDPDKEKRLVDRGVAVYVLEPAAEPVEGAAEPVADAEAYEAAEEPIGFDEVPELPEGVTAIPQYSMENTADELREIGAMCGLTFKKGMNKAAMIKALDKHIEENTVEDFEDDGEPAPEFDASEAVL